MRGGWKKEIELELEGKFSESPYLIVPVLKKEREKKKLNPTSQRTYFMPNIQQSKLNNSFGEPSVPKATVIKEL